jgi:hypothetical protein
MSLEHPPTLSTAPTRHFWKWLCAALLTVAMGVALVGFIPTGIRKLYWQELICFLIGKGQFRGQQRFQQRLERMGAHSSELNLRLEVVKRERVLRVFNGGQLLATYPVGLGRQPHGQKERRDDFRTPIGTYRICYKNERSRYHLFLGADYPSPEDARRGLAAGIITATETEQILDAWMKNERPPWNTALGGPFGLHGFGAESDWTEGTIALHNAHIEEIFWNVPLGTPLTVLP